MTSTAYIELSFATAGPNVPALLACLEPLAPGGIAVEEPYVPLGPEEGVRLEPWRPTVLKLYLAQDADLGGRRRTIDAAVGALLFPVDRGERQVQEEDWAESWKQFFQVEHVGRRLVIRPTWRDYAPQPDEIVLDLDPGMAFGTGQHPTTRLCLAALEELLKPNLDALDLGCGSGILSLAAAKLGARSILALDTEAIAVDATRANTALNHIEALIRVDRGSLGERWPFEFDQAATADLIVANISAGVLVELAPAIAAALRPGGVLIGSGVVAERLDEVLLAFAAAGLSVEGIGSEADWRAVIARRPA